MSNQNTKSGYDSLKELIASPCSQNSLSRDEETLNVLRDLLIKGYRLICPRKGYEHTKDHVVEYLQEANVPFVILSENGQVDPTGDRIRISSREFMLQARIEYPSFYKYMYDELTRRRLFEYERRLFCKFGFLEKDINEYVTSHPNIILNHGYMLKRVVPNTYVRDDAYEKKYVGLSPEAVDSITVDFLQNGMLQQNDIRDFRNYLRLLPISHVRDKEICIKRCDVGMVENSFSKNKAKYFKVC